MPGAKLLSFKTLLGVHVCLVGFSRSHSGLLLERSFSLAAPRCLFNGDGSLGNGVTCSLRGAAVGRGKGKKPPGLLSSEQPARASEEMLTKVLSISVWGTDLFQVFFF